MIHIILLLFWLLAPAVQAADAPAQLEVTADQSLEWHQEQKLYIARGNAKAVQGDTMIEADLMTAEQKPDAGDGKAQPSGAIERVIAEGNVRITSPRQKIFGDRLDYDLNQKLAIVTGTALRLETEQQTVTARDALEYHEGDGRAIARGNAVAVEKDRRVEADTLTAHFTTDKDGKQQLEKIIAEGNVTIITPTDIAKGQRAIYNVAQNKARLGGNVRITREDTQLAGDIAEVDFKSGTSRLLNTGKGRVRALLTGSDPASLNKNPGAL